MPGTITDSGDKKLYFKVSLFSSSLHSNVKRKKVNKKTQVNKIISSCAEWYEELQSGGGVQKDVRSWGRVCS